MAPGRIGESGPERVFRVPVSDSQRSRVAHNVSQKERRGIDNCTLIRAVVRSSCRFHPAQPRIVGVVTAAVRQRWEYRVVETADRESLQPELTIAGHEGWELVSSTAMFNTWMSKVVYVLFLKRPLPQQ